MKPEEEIALCERDISEAGDKVTMARARIAYLRGEGPWFGEPGMNIPLWRGEDVDREAIAVVMTDGTPKSWFVAPGGVGWIPCESVGIYRAWGIDEREGRLLAEGKVTALGNELRASLAREAALRLDLALVRTDVEGVWYWQGDCGDHPESLSCPVVMSADRLRELVAAKGEG